MAIFKCKMCGGALEINNNETVATCEYCGTQQTLPKLDDDKRANMYDRANHFRRNNEYDKAMGIYENILNEDNTDAEAYWSLVLCRYGIEYVEDPASHKRVPTVNRAQFTAVSADENFKLAIKHANTEQKKIYKAEAKAIDNIQKGILEISQKEEPFDVFICYKETDNNGRRTPDSVLANDLYHQLTQEGFKVFFSRITLEDKLGTAYEPYIFAALNSAKVMVVLGTKPEYFNAVWVKNEWSRYLALVKNSNGKKILIPAYKDMDPYDLPEEFSHLQAQDMSKLGFMQDLIRGIQKIVQAEASKATVVKETVFTGGNANTAPLLKRAFMFLEDGEFDRADEFCEQVLNIDPECAEAYLGKLLSELKVRKQESLKDQAEPFDSNNNYQKVIRFADEKLKSTLAGYVEHINTRNENTRLDSIYNKAKSTMAIANTENEFKEAARLFETISEHLDSAKLAQVCYEKAEAARKDAILVAGKMKMTGEVISDYEAATKLFESISGWKDADENIYICQKKIEEIKAKAEVERLEKERQAEITRKKEKKALIIVGAITGALLTITIVFTTIISPAIQYSKATKLEESGDLRQAYMLYSQIENFSDSVDRMTSITNQLVDGRIVSAGSGHTVGLKADGTVVAVGYNYYDQCNVSDWTDIVAVSAGANHSVGLTTDNTVVAVGNNLYDQCNVSGWADIVAVSTGANHTVGLKADGTVVAVGYNRYDQCDVSGWTDIVAVSTGANHTVGLKADGTVVAVGYNDVDQCDVSGWTDIVAVSAGTYHTVGLKADGTVVAVGYNDADRCDVSGWTDIVAVSAGSGHTVGLKADGTVVAVGYNRYDQCDVSGWTDIVAVSAGSGHTVGLKADGTVVAVGLNSEGQCDVNDWENIKLPNNIRGN